MVEKERLPLHNHNDNRDPEGLLKTRVTLNNPIPEDKMGSLDRPNSGLSGLTRPTEVDKFNTLCDGVLSAHSMFDICISEIFIIKDELLKYPLPSNLLINLTLSCSKLYRSASDLSVPTNELVRLVRLYSAQWEAKSNVLKKLHEDYESKQRRLDIALKKLELVGVSSERIEKEKRIMNWEKIFSKVMSAKSHGHRWKFLINSLKEKVKSGEILSVPFPSNSTDEEPNDGKSETFVPRHHRRNVKGSNRHQSLLRGEAQNRRNKRISDEQAPSNEGESGLSSEEDEKHDIRRRMVSNDRDAKINITSSRFKSKYPFDREDLPRRFKSDRIESPTGMRNPKSPRSTAVSRRFMPIRNDGKKNVSFFDESSEVTKPKAPEKEEKSVWTGDVQYDRFLHVRVYKPDCKKVPEPVCTICFGEQVSSSGSFGIDEDVSEKPPLQKDKKLSRTPLENKFQEFVFTLPEGNIYEKGKPVWKVESQQLRIAVQPGKGKPMAAMCTVEYNNLNIPEKDIEKDDLSDLSTVDYPLLSLMSDKETIFNSVIGHVPLVCYQSKKERLLSLNQSTQTLSIQELFNEMLEAKRTEDEERENLEEKEPEKIYTENDVEELKQKHDEEMEFLHKDYEFQLQQIFRATNSNSPDRPSPCQSEPKLVNACTSPLPRNSPSPQPQRTPQRPRTADGRSWSRKGKKIKTTQVLPEWGKDLPDNFFDRLEQFSQASAKHRQELSERTKKAIQENYELQMATQNRLNVMDDEIDLNDVCLPALFMPSRMGTVYSPKASLYFHPSGIAKGRFTQPPSVFKLPFVAKGDHSSVLNLFDLSQSFLQTGPTWLSQEGSPRSTSPNQKNTFPVNLQETCAKLKSE